MNVLPMISVYLFFYTSLFTVASKLDSNVLPIRVRKRSSNRLSPETSTRPLGQLLKPVRRSSRATPSLYAQDERQSSTRRIVMPRQINAPPRRYHQDAGW
jgi:hypothetical protein